jgi:hypothetical protein
VPRSGRTPHARRNRAQGGGAGTDNTETAPADLGVKTMPKGDLDIYTKPKGSDRRLRTGNAAAPTASAIPTSTRGAENASRFSAKSARRTRVQSPFISIPVSVTAALPMMVGTPTQRGT